MNRDRSYTDLTLEDELVYSSNISMSDVDLRRISDDKAIDRILCRRKSINQSERFNFFWETESPFSQWFKSKFFGQTFIVKDQEIVRILSGSFPVEGQEYTSSEQFMMYHKAIIFLDREIANQIMKTSDVRKIKKLGKQVRNFDQDVWLYFRSKVVYEGNKSKFFQNEYLKTKLFETKGTTLVEASPNDAIWGIGLTRDDPRSLKRETWLGENLLGEILTRLRIDLMGEY